MMPENKIKKDRFKTTAILAAVVLLVVLLGVFFYYKQLDERKRIQPPEFLTFTGLPADAGIEAVLTTRAGVVSLPVENGVVILDQEQRENFYLPFKLEIHILGKDGKYRDLVITLDQSGVEYSVLFDGFRPHDRIFITMNGAESTADYYTDWSGRYLAGMVFNIGHDMRACARIETDMPFGFCQSFPARKKGGM